jgi:uncharacterized protein YfiM (DUF2279 family)
MSFRYFLLGCALFLYQWLPAQDTTRYSVVNQRRVITAAITESVVYGGGMAYLWQVWYKDVPRVPFQWYNDSRGYLQIDKCGHAYAAYWQSYVGYHWLRSAGVSKKKSLLYGAPLGLVLQTPIEIFDGLYEGWGFSWSDMAANTAGPLLMAGQEMLFDRQWLTYKFSFTRSSYARQAHGYLGDNTLESLFYDYNGHTYWLSMPLMAFKPLKKVPEWIQISAGYSANGMYGEFTNRTSFRGKPIPPAVRHRQFLLSMDIGWNRIPVKSRFLKGVLLGLSCIKLPFPALEYNTTGKFKAHWLYF